jgi:transposase, IS4 family protein
VDRLSTHLSKGTSALAINSYLSTIKKWCPKQPVVHIDDSYVVKPDGYKFESLCLVRDGSESTAQKSVYKKGYHVTEAVILANSSHSVSFFLKFIHQRKKISHQLTMLLFLQLTGLPQ